MGRGWGLLAFAAFRTIAAMTSAGLRDTVSFRRHQVRLAMLRSFAVVAFLGSLIASAAAPEVPRASECLAMANAPPRATPVSLNPAPPTAAPAPTTSAAPSPHR